MPDPMNGEPSDPTFEEAAIWLARLQEPDVSAADRAGFARWLAHDPARRAAFDEAQRLSAALDAPAKALADDAIIVPFPSPARPATSPARYRPRTVAAGALAIAILAGIWLQQGGLDDLRSDYVTASGERETVALADGSTILLNTGTAVAVDLAADRRSVRMFRGEAAFTVSTDAARPFTVTTGDGQIHVLGTAFNVRLTSQQTVVSVLRGRVGLSSAVGPDAAEMKLVGGQSASIGAAGVSPPAAFDRTAVTAWQRGQLVFYRTPLGEVVDELNRYQRGRILILSNRVRDLPVSGVFDVRRPAAVIDVIERTLEVKATRLTDHLILLR